MKTQLETGPPKKKSLAAPSLAHKKSKEPALIDSESESEPEILDQEDSLNSEDDIGMEKNTHKRIVTFGSKFSVMNELFIQPNAFLVARPSRASSLVPTRYSSTESKRAGIVAELYEEVPEDCHILLETDLAFRQTVGFH